MKSWKTTIAGLIGAVATALYPLLIQGKLDPQALITAAIIAILGVLAKDFNVSGKP